jgi:hypothetical protein
MIITEVEIYMNQFKGFFEKNPNDLTELIGKSNIEDFYDEVKKQSNKNYENGDDVSLTQRQIIDIVVKLNKIENNESEIKKIEQIIIKTEFAEFSLN